MWQCETARHKRKRGKYLCRRVLMPAAVLCVLLLYALDKLRTVYCCRCCSIIYKYIYYVQTKLNYKPAIIILKVDSIILLLIV